MAQAQQAPQGCATKGSQDACVRADCNYNKWEPRHCWAVREWSAVEQHVQQVQRSPVEAFSVRCVDVQPEPKKMIQLVGIGDLVLSLALLFHHHVRHH